MRILNKHYDIVYTDLDNTLVYGFITDLMDITWKLFKSQLIATALMYIQSVFRLYKVNHKLLYMIKRSELPIVILTARKHCMATQLLINQLELEDQGVCLVELATQVPEVDKVDAIIETGIKDNKRCVLFDDNKRVLQNAIVAEIDAFDGSAYMDEKIK